MGLHYPFGYVGYESAFLETFIQLLDYYCTSCHTNYDVSGDCHNCPIGNLVYDSKEYLETAIESGILKEEAKVIRKIKRCIKQIKPYPLFNSDSIFQKKRSPDQLFKLRKLLTDLKFIKQTTHYRWMMKEDIETKVLKELIRCGHVKIKKEAK